MDLALVVETRFERTPDGRVWALTQDAYATWQRYLRVFDGVRVVARVRDVAVAAPGSVASCGPGVEFAAVPYYVGPRAYLRNLRRVRDAVGSALRRSGAVLLRVPSPIVTTAFSALRKSGRPYGVEVVGDPWQMFAPGGFVHPLRPILRIWYTWHMRRQCRHASVAAYVTREVLQRHYPAGGFSTHYTDVDLRAEAMRDQPPIAAVADGPWRLVTVGSLEFPCKAVDVLLEAITSCVHAGLDLELRVLGDGRLRGELEAQASALGLDKRVRFLGKVPAGEAVRAELDAARLFVIASRTEGLPRALLEAMARGLPCVGTAVGGIPELLPSEDLVAPGEAPALAAKLREVLSEPGRLERMARRNRDVAGEHRLEALETRREDFYRRLRAAAEEWQKTEDSTASRQR